VSSLLKRLARTGEQLRPESTIPASRTPDGSDMRAMGFCGVVDFSHRPARDAAGRIFRVAVAGAAYMRNTP
jgi:hypothetical protein